MQWFHGTSTAGSATITSNSGSFTNFHQSSTAGSAAITNNNQLVFLNSSTAGNATITNNSRLNSFNNGTAGRHRTITNGAGATTNFSTSNGPNGDSKLSAGSIAGGGTFNLGANELTVGGNNLSTTVS